MHIPRNFNIKLHFSGREKQIPENTEWFGDKKITSVEIQNSY